MTTEQLSLFIINIYLQIESEILDNIGKTLAMPEGEVNILQWQLMKLQQLGRLTEENYKLMASKSGLTVEAIKKIIAQEGYAGASLVDAGLGAVPLALNTSNAIAATLMLLEAQAVDKLNLVNTTMLSGAQQVYRDIINQTTAKVLTGLMTPHEALRSVSGQWAERGVPTIRDKSGKVWSTEAYVPMVVRSTVKNVSTDAQISRMDDHDIDLIEVSSHNGARPKCEPYQGRIFSKSGKSKKYPAWSTTSYGQPDGLLGINCHHVIYPYVEGRSTQRYKPYPKEQNDKAYKESQQQRAIERDIRKKKKRLVMAKATGDKVAIKQANQQVRAQQERMRNFLKETGRRRKPNREQIV
ncbi:minor capsid protein [Bacillus phage Carmen17]|uniref:Minor capsid protein n=1 Tax=Bacillus phage Carmen17 TaxID=2072797 RepID=A0A2I7QIP4_9CAUD|nr:minor head protein [Bacillus phage Carmen17]AUR81274.1 minor capsid protein [Bacillus phage Carmen17]